ncbi:hypothetical protein RI129_006124 [Pyrocoelia pectoralis]|uniref:Carboxypeptidase n=1 Tax=Pyrocoelia pectoralis TaxID=417401 RepID=A0AAN7VJM2_9COLE
MDLKILIGVVLYLMTLSSGENTTCNNNIDDCNPLILTTLIRKGKVKEARLKAEVKHEDFKNVKSYSGYFTVNENFNSNLFFWFFPSEVDYEEAPVILWLQGGPGTTCMAGVFLEHGPFMVQLDLTLKQRESRWTKNHSLIYIDNPVGTGYSFTDPNTYAQNQTIIGDHLYTALIQFFQLFPEIQKNPFYVMGESYAGKYVPAVSYTIHKRNPTTKFKINLQGLAIGNGFSDPVHQMKYGEYFFQLGLIDTNEKKEVEARERHIIDLIHDENWEEAYFSFSNLIYNGNDSETLFTELTGYNNTSDLLEEFLTGNSEMLDYITLGDVMSALHVSSNHTFRGQVVIQNLIPDFMQSVASWISELLNSYRVLIYNGQLDVIVPYIGTVNYLTNLNFSGSDLYKNVSRGKWWVNDKLAGYVKCAGNLTEVLVRNSGHMVPVHQPMICLDLISKFTRNKSIY